MKTAPTILFIDDDQSLSGVYLEVLELEGISAMAASSGEEALKVLPMIEAPRLLFVDFLLPGLNGPDLFQKLREAWAGQKPAPRIYSFSSLDNNCGLFTDIESLVDGFVQKPADLNEFLELISDLLAGKPNRHLKPAA